MSIFNENGEKLGLLDVCKWWLETYPRDVFVSSPGHIVAIGKHMEEIIKERDELTK